MAAAPSHAARTGRPRRLQLDAILSAANEIGLDRLEMVHLARKLGVGVATIYGYVRSREELIRLAAGKHAQRDAIADTDQSWQDALREHAATSFRLYDVAPEMLVQMARGTINPAVETVYRDGMIGLLTRRGIGRGEALRLYYETNQIVSGAALGRIYRGAGTAEHARALPRIMGRYEEALERLIGEKERMLDAGKREESEE